MSQSGPSGRIPTLDGWRGIAILMVLADHSLSLIRSDRLSDALHNVGKHGVAIFFVLSGFLITRQLADKQVADLLPFYIRRAFRLLPTALIYLAVVGVITHVTRREMLGCLFFFRNYVPESAGTDVTSHFWSLSIEEQFYLVWPFALILSGRRRAIWIALAIAWGVAFCRYATLSHAALFMQTAATQYRADALAIGCATALLLPQLRRIAKDWTIWPLALMFLFFCLVFHRIVPLSECVVIGMLLLATMEHPESGFSRALESRWLCRLGVASYAVYVWQQLFFMISASKPKAIPAALLMVGGFAIVTHIYLEQPLTIYGRSFAKRCVMAVKEPSTVSVVTVSAVRQRGFESDIPGDPTFANRESNPPTSAAQRLAVCRVSK